jgi:hypothetical protein
MIAVDRAQPSGPEAGSSGYCSLTRPINEGRSVRLTPALDSATLYTGFTATLLGLVGPPTAPVSTILAGKAALRSLAADAASSIAAAFTGLLTGASPDTEHVGKECVCDRQHTPPGELPIPRKGLHLA